MNRRWRNWLRSSEGIVSSLRSLQIRHRMMAGSHQLKIYFMRLFGFHCLEGIVAFYADFRIEPLKRIKRLLLFCVKLLSKESRIRPMPRAECRLLFIMHRQLDFSCSWMHFHSWIAGIFPRSGIPFWRHWQSLGGIIAFSHSRRHYSCSINGQGARARRRFVVVVECEFIKLYRKKLWVGTCRSPAR